MEQKIVKLLKVNSEKLSKEIDILLETEKIEPHITDVSKNINKTFESIKGNFFNICDTYGNKIISNFLNQLTKLKTLNIEDYNFSNNKKTEILKLKNLAKKKKKELKIIYKKQRDQAKTGADVQAKAKAKEAANKKAEAKADAKAKKAAAKEAQKKADAANEAVAKAKAKAKAEAEAAKAEAEVAKAKEKAEAAERAKVAKAEAEAEAAKAEKKLQNIIKTQHIIEKKIAVTESEKQDANLISNCSNMEDPTYTAEVGKFNNKTIPPIYLKIRKYHLNEQIKNDNEEEPINKIADEIFINLSDNITKARNSIFQSKNSTPKCEIIDSTSFIDLIEKMIKYIDKTLLNELDDKLFTSIVKDISNGNFNIKLTMGYPKPLTSKKYNIKDTSCNYRENDFIINTDSIDNDLKNKEYDNEKINNKKIETDGIEIKDASSIYLDVLKLFKKEDYGLQNYQVLLFKSNNPLGNFLTKEEFKISSRENPVNMLRYNCELLDKNYECASILYNSDFFHLINLFFIISFQPNHHKYYVYKYIINKEIVTSMVINTSKSWENDNYNLSDNKSFLLKSQKKGTEQYLRAIHLKDLFENFGNIFDGDSRADSTFEVKNKIFKKGSNNTFDFNNFILDDYSLVPFFCFNPQYFDEYDDNTYEGLQIQHTLLFYFYNINFVKVIAKQYLDNYLKIIDMNAALDISKNLNIINNIKKNNDERIIEIKNIEPSFKKNIEPEGISFKHFKTNVYENIQRPTLINEKKKEWTPKLRLKISWDKRIPKRIKFFDYLYFNRIMSFDYKNEDAYLCNDWDKKIHLLDDDNKAYIEKPTFLEQVFKSYNQFLINQLEEKDTTNKKKIKELFGINNYGSKKNIMKFETIFSDKIMKFLYLIYPNVIKDFAENREYLNFFYKCSIYNIIIDSPNNEKCNNLKDHFKSFKDWTVMYTENDLNNVNRKKASYIYRFNKVLFKDIYKEKRKKITRNCVPFESLAAMSMGCTTKFLARFFHNYNDRKGQKIFRNFKRYILLLKFKLCYEKNIVNNADNIFNTIINACRTSSELSFLKYESGSGDIYGANNNHLLYSITGGDVHSSLTDVRQIMGNTRKYHCPINKILDVFKNPKCIGGLNFNQTLHNKKNLSDYGLNLNSGNDQDIGYKGGNFLLNLNTIESFINKKEDPGPWTNLVNNKSGFGLYQKLQDNSSKNMSNIGTANLKILIENRKHVGKIVSYDDGNIYISKQNEIKSKHILNNKNIFNILLKLCKNNLDAIIPNPFNNANKVIEKKIIKMLIPELNFEDNYIIKISDETTKKIIKKRVRHYLNKFFCNYDFSYNPWSGDAGAGAGAGAAGAGYLDNKNQEYTISANFDKYKVNYPDDISLNLYCIDKNMKVSLEKWNFKSINGEDNFYRKQAQLEKKKNIKFLKWMNINHNHNTALIQTIVDIFHVLDSSANVTLIKKDINEIQMQLYLQFYLESQNSHTIKHSFYNSYWFNFYKNQCVVFPHCVSCNMPISENQLIMLSLNMENPALRIDTAYPDTIKYFKSNDEGEISETWSDNNLNFFKEKKIKLNFNHPPRNVFKFHVHYFEKGSIIYNICVPRKTHEINELKPGSKIWLYKTFGFNEGGNSIDPSYNNINVFTLYEHLVSRQRKPCGEDFIKLLTGAAFNPIMERITYIESGFLNFFLLLTEISNNNKLNEILTFPKLNIIIFKNLKITHDPPIATSSIENLHKNIYNSIFSPIIDEIGIGNEQKGSIIKKLNIFGKIVIKYINLLKHLNIFVYDKDVIGVSNSIINLLDNLDPSDDNALELFRKTYQDSSGNFKDFLENKLCNNIKEIHLLSNFIFYSGSGTTTGNNFDAFIKILDKWHSVNTKFINKKTGDSDNKASIEKFVKESFQMELYKDKKNIKNENTLVVASTQINRYLDISKNDTLKESLIDELKKNLIIYDKNSHAFKFPTIPTNAVSGGGGYIDTERKKTKKRRIKSNNKTKKYKKKIGGASLETKKEKIIDNTHKFFEKQQIINNFGSVKKENMNCEESKEIDEIITDKNIKLACDIIVELSENIKKLFDNFKKFEIKISPTTTTILYYDDVNIKLKYNEYLVKKIKELSDLKTEMETGWKAEEDVDNGAIAVTAIAVGASAAALSTSQGGTNSVDDNIAAFNAKNDRKGYVEMKKAAFQKEINDKYNRIENEILKVDQIIVENTEILSEILKISKRPIMDSLFCKMNDNKNGYDDARNTSTPFKYSKPTNMLDKTRVFIKYLHLLIFGKCQLEDGIKYNNYCVKKRTPGDNHEANLIIDDFDNVYSDIKEYKLEYVAVEKCKNIKKKLPREYHKFLEDIKFIHRFNGDKEENDLKEKIKVQGESNKIKIPNNDGTTKIIDIGDTSMNGIVTDISNSINNFTNDKKENIISIAASKKENLLLISLDRDTIRRNEKFEKYLKCIEVRGQYDNNLGFGKFINDFNDNYFLNNKFYSRKILDYSQGILKRTNNIQERINFILQTLANNDDDLSNKIFKTLEPLLVYKKDEIFICKYKLLVDLHIKNCLNC